MVNKEDVDFYCNLPRKELQSLCKEYGLPANRSSSDMAESLVCYFEKKGLRPIILAGGLSGIPEASFAPSLVLPLQCGGPLNSIEDARRECCGPISCTREGAIGGNHSQNIQFKALACGMGDKAYDKETFGSSTYSQVVPRFDGNNFNNDNPAINFEKNCLSFPRDHRVEDRRHIEHKDTDFVACPKGNAALESSGATKSSPFEFHVSSEEGINLCVDLNWNPSDWIEKLKSEVCRSDIICNNKSQSFNQEIGLFGESTKKVKSSSNSDADQSKEGYILKESSCSIMKEDNQSPSDHVVEGEGSLTSCAINQCDKVEDALVNAEEEQELNSSICNSAAPDGTVPHSKSSSEDVDMMSLNSDVNSLRKESAGDSVVNTGAGPINLNILEHHSRKLSNKICEKTCLQNTSKLENSTIIIPRYPGLGCVEMSSSEVETRQQYASGLPCQIVQSLDLAATKNIVETKQDGLANSTESNNESCRSHFPSCVEELLPINDSFEINMEDLELLVHSYWENAKEKGKIISGREHSECSHDDSFGKTCITLNGVEFDEEHRRKRLHIDGESHNFSGKPEAKIITTEHPSNKVLPRRSMRLVPK